MDARERFGLEPEEYEKCVKAAEELRTLGPDPGAPTAEDLARDWSAAKATHRRLAIPLLWKALGFEAGPLVRRLVPQGPEGSPSRG
jgi:hypothetical protein